MSNNRKATLARRIYTLLLVGLSGLGVGVPHTVAACGLPLQARIAAEQALIVHSNGRQQIITSVQLDDVQGRAAVVFPVPGAPEVDQPPGGAELFSYLEQVTRPQEEVVRRVVWGGQGATSVETASRGVAVLGRDIIGGYDVARLAADDPQALGSWLDANGYNLPPGAQPILDAYVSEGWKFVAVKLAPTATAGGALSPLRMSFASTNIVYPMRLGALADRPLNLQIYILTDRRVAIESLETLYAGPVAQLDPAPPPGLAVLFASASYLTRLHAPALKPRSLSADFVAQSAPDNQPYRATRIVYQEVSALRAYGLPMAIFCLILINVLSLAIAFFFKRRFDAINPTSKR